ncbi:MAG: hypothetical protein ACXWUX_02515 [Allosphingosinicella sp.]
MPRLQMVPREEPGFEAAPAPLSVAPIVATPVPPPAPPLSPEYHVVHDRLTALERLARLRDEGALTAREYAAEKALVLALPADELVLQEAAPRVPELAAEILPVAGSTLLQSPPLIDRFAGWKLLPLGLGAGLALSYASQPRETVRFLEDVFRLFGG